MTDIPKKKKSDLKHEIAAAAGALGCPEPHIYLTSIMAGVDPRQGFSELYRLLQAMFVAEDKYGRPSLETYTTLKKYVQANPHTQHEPIPAQDSTAAASQLMGYCHPKLQAVKVSGELEHLVKVVPLTKEEIERVEALIFDEF